MEHQHLPCSNCGVTLRLTISEINYGRKVEITCPKCETKSQTIIVDPKEMIGLMNIISSVVAKSGEVYEAIQNIRQSGFRVDVALFAKINIVPQGEKSPESKVQDDEITLETFSPTSDKWVN